MSLIEIIKNDIFAERFGGSLYTRFNQGQLEGLPYFLVELILNFTSYHSFVVMGLQTTHWDAQA